MMQVRIFQWDVAGVCVCESMCVYACMCAYVFVYVLGFRQTFLPKKLWLSCFAMVYEIL